MKILVTGAAGFIGSAVCQALVNRGDNVTGIDSLDDYYDVGLKKARLEQLGMAGAAAQEAGRMAFPTRARLPGTHGGFEFRRLNLVDHDAVEAVLAEGSFATVIHLAAQPGVRYSLENPRAYIDANVVGFLNVLEGCRHHGIGHLVYASSSSVYGANESMPFSVGDNVDHPVSLYAATKKSNELMAHAYAHLYRLPCTGLRFFTVYGPWGRPDMAPVLFTRAILAGEPIRLFNHGRHRRDFTYIDDIVGGVLRVLDRPARPDPEWSGSEPNPASSNAPWRLYNIGNGRTVELARFVEVLEQALGREAVKEYLPLQPGDVPDTCADVQSLVDDFGYQPRTTLEEGIRKFIAWYRSYYEA